MANINKSMQHREVITRLTVFGWTREHHVLMTHGILFEDI